MTDNLNEKNKQVKDDFMNEISKVVKKNISENSDLTEEKVIGIAIRVLRPNAQTPKYDPKHVLSPEFAGDSNYEAGISDLLDETKQKLDRLLNDPETNPQEIELVKNSLKKLE